MKYKKNRQNKCENSQKCNLTFNFNKLKNIHSKKAKRKKLTIARYIN